jgi:ABC-2 type transport system ATP-binding protein
VLEVRGLTVRSREGRSLVDDVSFDARPGEILAVLGPNGAGKTTLLEAVAGLRPCEGTVRHEGRALDGFRARAQTFAFMPDDAVLPEEMSVELFLRGEHGSSLGLERIWSRSPGRLSRGEAKRVWLAWALAQERPVTILDEPFGAFDPLELDRIIAVVQGHARRGGAVIASIHQMSTAMRVADRIALLAAGRLVAEGTLDELRARAGTREDASLEDVFRAVIEEARAASP